jgi:hypothetical protein
MPTITITRDAPLRRDRLRHYRVIIDGEFAGLIGHGNAEAFDVTPGRHIVELKIDWCSSPPLIVDVRREGARLVCGPNWTAWRSLIFPLLLWQVTFGRNRWISLAMTSSKTGKRGEQHPQRDSNKRD